MLFPIQAGTHKKAMSSNSTRNIEVRRHSAAGPWTYALLDQRQRAAARDVVEHGAPPQVLLSELAPVITLGKRPCSQDLLWPREEYARQGIDVFQADRGGFATYHGPGQWVLFYVDRLERMVGDPRGVKKAVLGLLQWALEVVMEWEPQAEIRDQALTGVWTPRGKVASVGVAVENGVLLHGLSLNVLQTPTSFVGLRPCGLDAQVDFLGTDPADMDAVAKKLLSKIETKTSSFQIR